MTHEKLLDFIRNRMRMSHIYQPVMLRVLLESGGSATERQIAEAISGEDPGQVEYYEKITRDMVGKVLRKHELVKRNRTNRTWHLLGFEDLKPVEIEELITACQEKLEEYVESRGRRRAGQSVGPSVRARCQGTTGAGQPCQNTPNSKTDRRYCQAHARQAPKGNSPPGRVLSTNSAHELAGLSRRTSNALLRSGIHTLDDLATFSDEQLIRLKGIGKSALLEIGMFVSPAEERRRLERRTDQVASEKTPAPVATWINNLQHPPKRRYAEQYAAFRLEQAGRPRRPEGKWVLSVERKVDGLVRNGGGRRRAGQSVGPSVRARCQGTTGAGQPCQNTPNSKTDRRYCQAHARQAPKGNPPLGRVLSTNSAHELAGLSRRTSNALLRSGIHTLDDLATFSDEQLIRLKGIGQSALREIRQILEYPEVSAPPDLIPTEVRRLTIEEISLSPGIRKRLRSSGIVEVSELNQGLSLTPEIRVTKRVIREVEGAVSAAAEGVRAPTFLSAVGAFMGPLDQRDRGVLEARMGLQGTPPTLDELGEKYSLTRERVRQLQKRAREMLGEWPFREYVSRLSDLLGGRTSPAYLDLVPVEDPWLAGIEFKPYLIEWLEKHVGGAPTLVTVNSRTIICYSKQEDLRAVRDGVQGLVWSLGQPLDEEGARIFARAQLSVLGAEELADELVTELEREGRLVFQDTSEGSSLLIGATRSLSSLMRAILADAAEPMTVDELYSVLAAIPGLQQPSRRTLIHTLNHIGAFNLSDRRYGFRRHVPFAEEEIRSIGDSCLKAVTKGPSIRQWHCEDLLSEVQRHFDLDKWLLNAVLLIDGRLHSLGRLVWVSHDHKGAERISVQDEAVKILQEAGQPMNTADLRAEIERRRGGVGHRQLLPKRPMIRIGRGRWGLVNRDVGADGRQIEMVLGALETALEDRQIEIHISEIGEIPGVGSHGVLPYAVMDLAYTDARFSVIIGALIGLSKWENRRRMTRSQALAQAWDLVAGDPDRLADKASELWQGTVAGELVRTWLAKHSG